MEPVICLLEQATQFGSNRLPGIVVKPEPLDQLVPSGWDAPLVVTGDVFNLPSVRLLIQQAYRNPAPLLVFPPFPLVELTEVLVTPAPVSIISHAANELVLEEKELWLKPEQDKLRLYSTAAINTPLQTGVMATAHGKPVIWRYQPTRAATAVVLISVQLMLVTARSDPLDREALSQALLAWAWGQVKPTRQSLELTTEDGMVTKVDPGLLRAIVIGLHLRPDLTAQTLPAWLATRLFVRSSANDTEAAMAHLQQQQALDSQGQPVARKITHLIDEWQLHAWVREARQNEAGNE